MEAMLATGAVEAVAILDPSLEMAAEAQRLAPHAKRVDNFEDLLNADVDGVVIASPNAFHAEQSILALRRGAAVFCQKPLGRTAAEVRAVVDAARDADRLLAVDLSYRFTDGMRRIRDLVGSGDLGRVYALDLVFHNAYGPDKGWFYDRALSGGGCVMDLGVHLVDLALWTLNFPTVVNVASALFSGGERLPPQAHQVEDCAFATLELSAGVTVRLACSWKLSAGCDALISAHVYGTAGGAALRNVDGSFYDFVAERYRGTARELLAEPPDSWGGRAAADWAQRLAAGQRFDADVEQLIDVAQTLDLIYARS